MHIWVQELAERQLPSLRRNPQWGWGVGLGLFAIAVALRWALEGILPVGLPFITFFIAILAATLVGGARVGVTVLALSLVASWYLFIEPRFSFRLDGSAVAALSLFGLFGGAIVAIGHELNVTVERLLAERRRSNELLRQSTRAEEKLAQLNRELLHRIRNIFTLATSIAFQTSRHATTPAEMASALTSRFQALAVAQELLVANELSGADLGQLAADTLKPLVPNADRLSLAGPPVNLSPEFTTSLCLVLHELATNAVKHGAWSNSKGIVKLDWRLGREAGVDPFVTLQWRETGGPPCGVPRTSGLGTLLIENAVSGAAVERNFLPEGLECSMQFAHGALKAPADAGLAS
jgi:two-component sensor histidine kinase